MNKAGYQSQSFWIRLVFMLVYWGLLNIALTLFGLLLFIVTIVKLGSKHEPTTLNGWLSGISSFIRDTIKFLSFDVEDKPYPFKPW
ncbi:DUF4389 domain-containing protein [Marinomonas mediterranea]|jgi:hypothetical protein|uniref:Lipase n=1 Tax=Marinomonas mediterranea (strain ATCC 700492 / JCM 21426 / NBRC 103028 / MMB-1) TaxID=717774 RepID=F2JTH2_MARM1|nr:DUF4389 domain-containing protein [Marinomonas mediterranea]ADZ91486.1 hypothetical protein Marme_2245 [Marinomonas mediterranea MMB-1]WCN09453.1 DUF4389 domain-containing protein [Marinomonas mediterranea]WCN13529.1 DUF4389 domain-containing protein [Marinomonas mediterranea]WCN17595.1 DUF4389 domain-containing protein [Marinomonas mediterranea MMB-1]